MADFKLLKEMQQAMQPKKTTEPYDTTAEVRRIEGKTAWVHIPGGVDETPVELTINAKEGDAVRVRVSGGQAWLMGNNTSPPTDDSTALRLTKQVDTDLTKKVNGLDQSLDQEELFKRITNNWLWQGIYLDEDTGNYYFNATYIHAGTISADRIHGGYLRLGGQNNGNGILETYNASGQLENRINNEGISIYDKGTYVGKITGYDDLGSGGTKVALLMEGLNYIEIATTYQTRLAYTQVNTSRQVQHKFEGDVYGDSDISAANIISRGKATLKGLSLTDGSAQTSPPYFLCLNNSYAQGGDVGYVTKANMPSAIGAVAKAGDTMTGNLTIYRAAPCYWTYSSDLDSQIGKTVPTEENMIIGRFWHKDNQNYGCAYSEVIKTTADDLYRSYAIRRKNAAGTALVNAFYQHIYADGSKGITFDSEATKEAWRSSLRLNGTVSTTNITSKNVATATDVTMGNTGSLSAGTYIIRYRVSFGANTTGRRCIYLATATDSSTPAAYSRIQHAPSPNATTEIAGTLIVTISSATTYYLRAYHQAGTTLACTGQLQVLKFHD